MSCKIVGKGTLLKLETTSGVLATIAHMMEFKAGMQKTETVECDDHDNTGAGIPKGPTGRTSQEDITGSFYFTSHATHLWLTTVGFAPLTKLNPSCVPITGSITRTDADVSTFDVAGIGFGTSYPLNDYVKADLVIVISKLIDYRVA